MTLTQRLITIGMVILGTVITRFLPFLVFPPDKPTPKYVQYLGKMLPSAALGLLVVYCFRDWGSLIGHHAAAVAVTVLLHVWKRQMSLSIAGGTILYMLLIRLLPA